jgi:hypothetical protein
VKLLHRLDILLRRLVNIVVRIVELVVLEVSCGTTSVSIEISRHGPVLLTSLLSCESLCGLAYRLL